jgi:hypothetical protein
MSPPFHRFHCLLILVGLLAATNPCQAILFKSSEYNCQVNLPDAPGQMNPWLPMIPSNDTDTTQIGITGARRTDWSAMVYLGAVKVEKKFTLTEKSIHPLLGTYFGVGLGFQNEITPIVQRNLRGLRVTGTHRYHGNNYHLVGDFYSCNGLVYEVIGLSTQEENPLKNPDIRAYLQSFKRIPE